MYYFPFHFYLSLGYFNTLSNLVKIEMERYYCSLFTLDDIIAQQNLMANRLTKINQLNNIESFIQVNLFKGYTFIDKAGEIINHFYINQVPPTVPGISPNGMIIKKPNDRTEELKVAPDAIWSHYLNPNSLDQIATLYSKNFQDIASIMNVNKITRVGWRNYFVYEYNSLKDREQSLKKLTLDEAMKAELMVYSLMLKRVAVTLSISKLSKKDQKQTP